MPVDLLHSPPGGRSPDGQAWRVRQVLCAATATSLSVFLVLACGGGEDARPFGTDPSQQPGTGFVGAAGRGGWAGGGLIRGTAGAMGVLDVNIGATGGTSAVDGGAGGRAVDGGAAEGLGGAGGTGGTAGRVDAGAAGSGPLAASGGRTAGSGGAISSGGSGHSGGVSGTGGVRPTSSGGAAAPGTGGARASTGGVSGTGGARAGSGGATAPGTGGATAMTPECQQYIRDYDAAMPSASMCGKDAKDVKDDKGMAESCAALVPAKLGGCGSNCTTYVDKPKMLEDIQKKWKAAGCTAPACPLSVCLNPRSATCSPNGACTNSVL